MTVLAVANCFLAQLGDFLFSILVGGSSADAFSTATFDLVLNDSDALGKWMVWDMGSWVVCHACVCLAAAL